MLYFVTAVFPIFGGCCSQYIHNVQDNYGCSTSSSGRPRITADPATTTTTTTNCSGDHESTAGIDNHKTRLERWRHNNHGRLHVERPTTIQPCSSCCEESHPLFLASASRGERGVWAAGGYNRIISGNCDNLLTFLVYILYSIVHNVLNIFVYKTRQPQLGRLLYFSRVKYVGIITNCSAVFPCF